MINPVEEFFEREAARYSEHFVERKSGRSMLFRRRLALACELAQGTRGGLLDCAIGTGEITSEVMASGNYNSAILIDISDEMLCQAKARLARATTPANVTFVHADIFQFLQTDDVPGPFSLILCLGLLAHTGRLNKLLDTLCRHLTTDGRILLQTSLEEHLGNRIWRALMHNRATASHGYPFSYFTHAQIAFAARQAGLAILETRRYGVGVPFIERLSPKANYYIEKACGRWASRNGAEAIYALRKTA